MCAIAELYETEQPSIFSYCLKRTSNWHVAEDLTSATFERALPLLPHDNPHALLLTIARYLVLDHWRQSRKRATSVFSDRFTAYDLDRYVELADGNDPIEQVIDACDTAMAAAFVRATLAACSDQELQIIDLRYVQRHSAAETADALGLTKQQYNKRHGGLMNRLAKRINPAPAREQSTCLICDGSIYGRGLCHYHYQHMREGKRIPLLPPKVQRTPTACQECGQRHYSRGYCRRHYEELRVRERMENRKLAGQLV